MVPSRHNLVSKVCLTALGASIFHLCCHLSYHGICVSSSCAGTSALIAVACLCGCCLHYCGSSWTRLHLENKTNSHLCNILVSIMKHHHNNQETMYIFKTKIHEEENVWICIWNLAKHFYVYSTYVCNSQAFNYMSNIRKNPMYTVYSVIRTKKKKKKHTKSSL
jgi:hypothetical protein